MVNIIPIIVIYGGQLGDEGKGKISELLAKMYNAVAVIRVGGSQADHTDILGKVHNVLPTCTGERLSILASGSYLVLDRLYAEMEGLTPAELMIDEAACIVLEEDRIESNSSGRIDNISSHGLGTRSAINSRLHGDFRPERFPSYYEKLKPFITNTRKYIYEQLALDKYIILEGTQGFGLSNHLFDMYPYTTSRTITPYAFCCEAGVDPSLVEERVMCLRTFPIRVGGNSGPMNNEITWDEVTRISDSPKPIIEQPICTGKVHRVSMFDYDMVVQAIAETKPTLIVMNMLDYIDYNCVNGITEKALKFLRKVEHEIGQKIDYVGTSSKSIIKL